MSLVDNELREKLAEYAHRTWAGWMEYMMSKCVNTVDGSGVVMPKEFYERWTRQKNTPYSELPENEKTSDRYEADRILDILEVHHAA